MALVVTEVSVRVNQSLERAFEQLVPIPLTEIFTGQGLIPAITGTRDEPANWGAVGQIRQVVLADGRTIEEELHAVDGPGYFAYTLRKFPGILGLLAKSAKGEWTLKAEEAGVIRMNWRYGFTPRHEVLRPGLWLISRFLWRGYMRKVIDQVAKYVKREQAAEN